MASQEGRPFVEADEAAPVLNIFLAGTAPPPPAPTASAGNTKADGKKAAGGAVAKAKPPPAVGKGGGKADKAKAPTGPAKEPPAVLTGDASITTPGGPLASQQYYITTAINYTNGNPHMGHAYEAITSDVIARYHRLTGRQVFFLTGTDEHGQKIAGTAQAQGVQPIDICDKYAGAFQALNRLLRISNDFYIRTTQPHHHETARRLWDRCAEAGDVYLGKYEGWYNVREETFVTENEAKLSNYLDPVSQVPLKKVEEPSYFFRMSKYQERLVAHIKDNPDFVRPEVRRKEILGRLEDPLLDLSVSRTTFDWGIPVPLNFDQKHVMYVWFDALSNYLSGVHGLEPEHGLSKFWPAQVHVIGKDIIWFHCVIWPCILMSAGVPLPESVFSHGFINGPDGRKMSKSLGNVVDPHDMISRYPVDSFRFYLTRETTYGGDLNFNEASLRAVHNNELADVLGNLVHRAVNLCAKYCGGVVPDLDLSQGWAPLSPPFDLTKLRDETEQSFAQLAIHEGAERAMASVRATNKFLTDAEPWKLKGDENDIMRQKIVRLTLEAVYAAAHFLAPYLPLCSTLIFDKLHHPQRPIPALSPDFINLKPGTSVEIGDILFVKIEEEDQQAAQQTAAAKSPAAGNAKTGGNKNGGGKKEAAPPAPSDPFEAADIRVGQIVKVWEHPSAERLFCEEVEVGEEKPRQIASGLREHYTLEQMQGRKVLVVCNLKAAKLAGFESQGMVLAGSPAEGGGPVVLVEVPEGAVVGERVRLADGKPLPAPAKELKRKVWEQLAAELKTTEGEGTATYQAKPIHTSGGACRVPGVLGGVIR